MGFVFDELDEKAFSKVSPLVVESLTRAVAFETPPAVAREILQETFEACTIREIADGVNAFQALLVINIDNYDSYLQELADLIHIAHSQEFRRGHVVTATLARHVSSEVSCRFLELAGARAKEEAKRISFLALLDSLRSLGAVIDLLVDKKQFVWMFTEAFMLVKSFVQATHIELIERSLEENREQSRAGKAYRPRELFWEMTKEIFSQHGPMSLSELLRYLKKNYPNGYDIGNRRFFVAKDEEGQTSLAHIGICGIGGGASTFGKVKTLTRKSVENNLSKISKQK